MWKSADIRIGQYDQNLACQRADCHQCREYNNGTQPSRHRLPTPHTALLNSTLHYSWSGTVIRASHDDLDRLIFWGEIISWCHNVNTMRELERMVDWLLQQVDKKLYWAHMGGTVGKICGNCVQDLEPILGKPHGNHMTQVDTHRIWVHLKIVF